MLTEHNTGVVPQVYELPPGPECEVVTVAFFSVFEVFWRLPIVLFVEKFLIRDVFASGQELANLFD